MGEFKDTPPSVWLSYEKPGNIRRTVDYTSDEMQVEMIVDKGTGIEQVTESFDKALYRLINTTQKEAYQTDVVSNRVEQKLSSLGNVLETAEMSDERLFSLQDLISLKVNHDGYIKVSTSANNVAVTDIRASAKADKDIVRVSFKTPHSIHKRAVKYARAVTIAAEKEKINDELIYAIMETVSSFHDGNIAYSRLRFNANSAPDCGQRCHQLSIR